MAKKPYKPIAKSRKNTSGRASKAKKDAEKLSMRMASGKANVMKTRRSGKERLAQGIPYKLKPMEAMTVRQLPSTPNTIKGMTLRQLIKATPRIFINNAVDVEAARVDMKKTKTGRPVISGRMVTHDPWRKDRVRRVHEAYIVGMGDEPSVPVNRHKKVLAQCGCENFVYVFEYANATMGASRLIYCNGQPPHYTNPGFAPGLCKHLVALAKIAIERNL